MEICGEILPELRPAVARHCAISALAFAAIPLLESAPQESFTGAHEDLPHLPTDLLE